MVSKKVQKILDRIHTPKSEEQRRQWERSEAARAQPCEDIDPKFLKILTRDWSTAKTVSYDELLEQVRYDDARYRKTS